MIRSKRLALVIASLVTAWFVWSVARVSFGQIERRASDAEVLARISVHEAGWEDTGDMEAIFGVLSVGGERAGISWRSFARSYARRLHAGSVSRLWASQLNERCAEPPSWPGPPHAPWSAYRERCEAVMVRAREVLSGARVHGCPVPPEDWGGRVDRARARRLGLVRIECARGDVDTRNDFYLRPRSRWAR